MKVVAALAFSLLASPSFANETVVGTACDVDQQCVELEFEIVEPEFTLFAGKKGGKGSGTFAQVAANATGKTVGAITSTLDSIRSGVLNAGYNSFKGELSGPAGTISFTYDFSSGAWSVSGSSKKLDKFKKVKGNDDGQN